MRFPNAHNGVKKIFIAEIVMVIATVAVLVGCIAAVVSLKLSSNVRIPEEAVPGALLAAGSLLGGAALGVFAAIFQIVGVVQAKKDENSFASALLFLFISIAASVVSASFSKVNFVQDLSDTVKSVCEVAVMIYIISGVRELAVKLERPGMKESANRASRLIFGVFGLKILAQLLAFVFDFWPAMVTAAAILAIVAAILNFVAYVYYVIFLAKAIRMLKE